MRGGRRQRFGRVWVVGGLLLTMFLGGRAWGVMVSGLPSLEWQVEGSELIVRGSVGPGAQRDVTAEGRTWREVTLDVRETIRGARYERVTFWMDKREPLAKEGTSPDVLVFLSTMEWARPAKDPVGRSARWGALHGQVFILGDDGWSVVRMDGERVTDGARLLQATREAAAFPEKHGGQRRPYILMEPYLTVPMDGRLEALARRWLDSERMARRETAVRILARFNTPEDLALIKGRLKDPGYLVKEPTEWTAALEWRARKEYPVRQAARLFVEPGPGEDSVEPYLRYVPVAWGGRAAGLAVVLAVAALWPGWWGRPAIGGRVAVVCAGLAVMAGVLWFQTQVERRSYSFARGGVDYEVVSYRGRLGVLRLRDGAAGHGWMVRRDGPLHLEEWLWFASMLQPGETAGVKGISFSRGKTGGGVAYPFRLMTVHYLWMGGVLGVWPVVWGVGRLRRARRRRRWARANRCAGCGYDLRGHGVGGRCPECGEGRGGGGICYQKVIRSWSIRDGARS